MTVISGYLALGTLDSTGTAFTELSAVVGGYARQAVTLVSGPDGAISNISALQFANSSPNDWPSFRAYAVFDSLTGGAQILVWDVAVSHTVRPARRHSVAAGKIQLKFPRAESNHGTEVFAAPRRRKVERLLSIMDSARDNNPYQRSAMSTPPTVAVGAATDGSLAAAIPLVSANALTTTTLTKMAWYGGIPTPTSTSHVAMPVASTLPALTGNLATLVNAFGITADLSSFAYATELMTDASVIEFAIWINNARKVMFQVDGQYVDFAGSAGLGSSAVNYFKLTFASGKARRIRVLMSTLPNAVTTLTSIRTNALASIWKPSQKDVLRLAWGGDSYGEGFNTSGTIFPVPNAAWPILTAELLGIRDCRQLSVASTGYLADGGTRSKLRDQIPRWAPHAPFDLLVLSHGFNDQAFATSAITAEVLYDLQLLRASYPDVPIVVLGAQPGNRGPNATTLAVEAAIAAGVTSFADPLCAFAPVSTDTPPWISGTGYNGATNGSGNSDLYIDTDNVHQSLAGAEFEAFRTATAIRNALNGMIAL
ncbi:hypothetical protein J4G48_0031825 [Bradyrhizobium barranii subsp. apii]|uniref:SGNH/GDSL hydrolase family protein n=1 Tax=Bradyrhizobium barranii TaxID=2992140 RepID=UPI001AA1168F|nr:SGNH/GDSL hydrolase family protein [Bradyrhizobium barranii]UPT93901.1 hypothetical protein J4G48_0031825 [Bradyrhizobium barranii subsp. apii]